MTSGTSSAPYPVEMHLDGERAAALSPITTSTGSSPGYQPPPTIPRSRSSVATSPTSVEWFASSRSSASVAMIWRPRRASPDGTPQRPRLAVPDERAGDPVLRRQAPVPTVVSVAAGRSGATRLAFERSGAIVEQRREERPVLRMVLELGRADALPPTSRTRLGGSPFAIPATAVPERTSGALARTPISRSPSARRGPASSCSARWRRRDARAGEHDRHAGVGERPGGGPGHPQALEIGVDERSVRDTEDVGRASLPESVHDPSFTSCGSGQNGTRTASPPDASHERPAQVAVSTAAGIPIAASETSIASRRRPVTRGPRYRARLGLGCRSGRGRVSYARR